MVLPVSLKRRPFQLGTVAVAWDFSRAAARAVSDALPLLERAKQVRIVTVINEKALDTSAPAKSWPTSGMASMSSGQGRARRSIGEVLEPTLRRKAPTCW